MHSLPFTLLYEPPEWEVCSGLSGEPDAGKLGVLTRFRNGGGCILPHDSASLPFSIAPTDGIKNEKVL